MLKNLCFPLICSYLCWVGSLAAQQTTVQFQPMLAEAPLEITEEVGVNAGAKQVEVLRFYATNFQLHHAGEVVFTQANSYHLIDAEVAGSLSVPLNLPADLAYDELVFTLGVDSLTAAGGVFGGDLDPTKGMYWTWRSGYINFKLEGTAPECPARKHRYQFHVGGFQRPFNSERTVRLPVAPAASLLVTIDLDHFFASVDLAQQYQIMSPSEASKQLADLLPALFRHVPTK